MQTGKLRAVVTIDRNTIAPDSFGDPSAGWATLYAGVRARITPIRGDEFLGSGQKVHSQVTHRITIRYRAGLKAFDRFSEGSRRYNIIWMQNVEEHDRELQCFCVEQVA